MTGRVIVAHVFAIDAEDITRTPDGAPYLSGRTHQASLHVATPSPGGGWMVETWHEEADEGATSRMVLVADVDALAMGIDETVRAIAVEAGS